MELQESKQKLDMVIIVGLEVHESISRAMKAFMDAFKNSSLNKGDSIFNPYKEFEGKFFKDESQFVLYNKAKGNQDLTHISMDNDELKSFLELCKDYGVDVLYLKRPDNLEELFHKYELEEPLSEYQKNIIEAYTIKNSDGNYILKQDASLICFNIKDFEIMDRILDKLEEKNMNIAKRKERAEKILYKMKKDKVEKDRDKKKYYSKEVK